MAAWRAQIVIPFGNVSLVSGAAEAIGDSELLFKGAGNIFWVSVHCCVKGGLK